MKIDGQCYCGQVRYEAEVDPAHAGMCHCTDCQIISGTAFRTVLRTPEAQFQLTGETKTYIKISASGNERAMVFCPNCGTQLYGTSVGDGPKIIGIRLGTSNQRAELPPHSQIWCQSAMPWLEGVTDLPGSQQSG
jgi:hypothetical protein